jgi:prefoldin subunit 5
VPENSLARELRPLVAAELRNRAAGEAVVAFYQLADLEGRAAVVRESIESLDVLRAAIEEAKKRGAKPPIDEEEVARQRATWIGLLGQAELGAKLLDADLKRRIGASGKTADRLMPTGDFGLMREVLDVEAAVKVGLERRADLIVLRTAYLKMSPENLPEVRELLRTIPGATGAMGGAGPRLTGTSHPRLTALDRVYDRREAEALVPVQAAADQEVTVRRGQVFTLIDEKERVVADEVRAQAAVLTQQARQVGLARWRVEKSKAKVADLKKDEQGAALLVQAELELNRERADLIQAVMAWHQARGRLNAAQGLYGK